ncbi:hypothetical protein ACWKWU_18400 [Chitinophaga lutea]
MVREQTSVSIPTTLLKCVLIGGGIALVLISAFLIGAGQGNPSWPKTWFVRPLVIVQLAGAAGGACFYMLAYAWGQSGWKKALGIVLGLILYVFVLWIGTVLGLDGTYWD